MVLEDHQATHSMADRFGGYLAGTQGEVGCAVQIPEYSWVCLAWKT